MAQGDMLKRYLDAGIAFTQMTRERAEAIVQDLVENGEIRRKEAQKRIEELLERSQKNTEELVGIIRREVAEQLKNMGLEDLAKKAGGDDAGAGTGDPGTAANPNTVAPIPSETPNAVDDSYPAPPIDAIKKAARKAGAATTTKSTGAKKAGAAKQAGAKQAGAATQATKAAKAPKATKATKKA